MELCHFGIWTVKLKLISGIHAFWAVKLILISGIHTFWAVKFANQWISCYSVKFWAVDFIPSEQSYSCWAVEFMLIMILTLLHSDCSQWTSGITQRGSQHSLLFFSYAWFCGRVCRDWATSISRKQPPTHWWSLHWFKSVSCAFE